MPYRSRRFVPALDRLQTRLALSAAEVVVTPMDPVLLGFAPPQPCEVVVTPMDPVLLGLGGAGPVGYDAPPASNGGGPDGDDEVDGSAGVLSSLTGPDGDTPQGPTDPGVTMTSGASPAAAPTMVMVLN